MLLEKNLQNALSKIVLIKKMCVYFAFKTFYNLFIGAYDDGTCTAA